MKDLVKTLNKIAFAAIGSCCLPDGSCEIMPPEACDSHGGTYNGDHSSCNPDPCSTPGPTGACCMPDGSCSIETADDCGSLGGEYNENVSCANANCKGAGGDPVGACCLFSSCLQSTLEQCSNMGGEWHGEDSNCKDTDCGGGGFDPTGACCNGENCSITTESECDGEYLGDYSDCSEDPCAEDEPIGACCCHGRECYDGISREDCLNSQCEWLGEESECEGNPNCNEDIVILPEFSCCGSGFCKHSYTDKQSCENAGFAWKFGNPYSGCKETCSPLVLCCTGGSLSPTCSVMKAIDCDEKTGWSINPMTHSACDRTLFGDDSISPCGGLGCSCIDQNGECQRNILCPIAGPPNDDNTFDDTIKAFIKRLRKRHGSFPRSRAGSWSPWDHIGEDALRHCKCCMKWEAGDDNPRVDGIPCGHPNVPHFSKLCKPRPNTVTLNRRTRCEHSWGDNCYYGWFDYNQNGKTDKDDLAYLLEHWGEPFHCPRGMSTLGEGGQGSNCQPWWV